MANFLGRLGTALLVAWMIVLGGCSTPTPNPITPPPPTRDGLDLDRNATMIAPDPSGLPYIIRDSDWVIPPGQTVTIMPGTEILVAGKYWIDIQGKLVAHGTADQQIHFSSAFTDTDLGQWRGLKLHNPDEGSELSFCTFTYGAFYDTDTLTDRGIDAQHYRGMLAIRNSSPTIEHCVVTLNQNNGVYITDDSTESAESNPLIRYNIFTENDASGVRADTSVNLALFAGRITYNCVADNSAPPFIMGFDSTEYGFYSRVNENVDSCDAFYNIDLPPLMEDPRNGDFDLQSCSPCVDAGPEGDGTDPDGTRADFGAALYVQASAELRGRVDGTLNATTYRVTCDLVIAPGEQLTIPAGAQLEATGLYSMEVYGTLNIQGTPENPVVLCGCQVPGGDIWGGIQFINREDAPSTIEYAVISGYNRIDVYKPGVQFTGVRFENAYEYGINVLTGSLDENESVDIDRCSFLNSGGSGIVVSGSAVNVRQSAVRGSRGRGISLSGMGESGVVSNTIVTACSTSAIVLENITSIPLINNVFEGCGYHGVHLNNNCSPMIINTVVSGNGRYGIIAENSSTPFLDYNNVWGNGNRLAVPEDYHGSSASVLIPGPGSKNENPLFAGGNDYHLQSGSPCIDAGNPDPIYNDAQGGRNDMGAYGGPGGNNVGPIRAPRIVASR